MLLPDFFSVFFEFIESIPKRALRVNDATRLDQVASYIAERQLAGRVGLLLTVFFPV